MKPQRKKQLLFIYEVMLPVLALFVAIPAAVVVGVVIALVQRVREIERGEEDDARNY